MAEERYEVDNKPVKTSHHQAHIPPLSLSPPLTPAVPSSTSPMKSLQPSIAGRARNLKTRRPDQLNTACPVMNWVVDQDRVLLAKLGRIKQVVSHQSLIPSKEKIILDFNHIKDQRIVMKIKRKFKSCEINLLIGFCFPIFLGVWLETSRGGGVVLSCVYFSFKD
jgi:hypothetical protein